MLEKILQMILRQYCGQFITGIDNMELAFWTGKILIQDAALKHNKINDLFKTNNIPLTIKYSSIRRLSIDVPWSKLSSAPVEIKIDGIFIVLKMNKVKKAEDKPQENKLLLIKNYIQHLSKKIQNNQENQQKSYFQKTILKIINNLSIDLENIVIRVENSDNIASSADFSQKSLKLTSLKSGQWQNNESTGFSMGFCLKRLSFYPIDEQGNRKFYHSESKVQNLRKMVDFAGISLYWEEKSCLNIFRVSQDRKNQLLENLITRQEHTLLLLDGKATLINNYNGLDYDFLMKIDRLDVLSTYTQLKQMIKVYANFMNASDSENLKKLQELDLSEQQKLKPFFFNEFRNLQNQKFSKCSEQMTKVLTSVSKKTLLLWSREAFMESKKRNRIDELLKSKNQKRWYQFLANQMQIQLSKEDQEQIQKEINDLFLDIEEKDRRTFRIQLFFSDISLSILHKEIEKKLEIKFTEINITTIKNQECIGVSVQVQDLDLLYIDEGNHKTTALIEKKKQEMKMFSFQFRLMNRSKKRKMNFYMTQVLVKHEINVLIMVKQLLKLREREQNQDIALKRVEVELSRKNLENELNREYQITIKMDHLMFLIEVSQKAFLYASIEGFNLSNEASKHLGVVNQFNLSYGRIKQDGKVEKNPILKDFTINFGFSGDFRHFHVDMDKLSIYLCQEDLSFIYKGLKKQATIFKVRQISEKNKRIAQNSSIEGKLKLMNIFKTWKVYYTILTENSLYFYSIDSTESSKPQHIIPLKNSKVQILSNTRFRIESENVNQIIECENQLMEEWIKKIQQAIFQCYSKLEMYQMIDGDQKNSSILKDFSTKVEIKFSFISILYSETKGRNIMQLIINNLQTNLHEHSLNFRRQICFQHILLKNCQGPEDSDLISLINNSELEKVYPIKILIEGKKKLNPSYQGELSISLSGDWLKLNYDAELIYRMIHKISWMNNFDIYPDQLRQLKVFQFLKEHLESHDYEEREEKLKEAKQLDPDYSLYTEIEQYRSNHSCVVLLNISFSFEKFSINLLNGRTKMCPFNAKITNLKGKIDKGANFLFVKVVASNLELFDVTGYPETNQKPWIIQQSYPILRRQAKKKNKQGIVLYFTKFPERSFINNDQVTSFLRLDLFDFDVNYQHQPVMRFVDFLINQIVLFVQQPSSLHKYDGPKRGPFYYEDTGFLSERQVKQIIKNCLHPNFNKLLINSYNMQAAFNSFPYDECITLAIQKATMSTSNFLNPERIKYKNLQLQFMEKYEIFKKLVKMKDFQEKIMKNHWVSRYNITLEGCSSKILQNQFNYEFYFDRAMHGEKDSLFPFLQIDKSIICHSSIYNLSVNAPRKVYNLINKCFLHNLTYDDYSDGLFQTNFEFKDKMTVSQLFFSVKLNQLSIIIPEIDYIIIIPQFEYKFIRYPSQVKQMQVNGKSLHILGKEKNLIIPLSMEENRGLQYVIEMKTSGEKKMSCILKSLQITYNLEAFKFLGQYFILDQSCYPKPKIYTDLPFIECHVHLVNSYIRIFQTIESEYVGRGGLSVIWTRNKVIHPDKVQERPELFPSGKQWDNTKIIVKGFQLRKYVSGIYEKQKMKSYRSLSGNIDLNMRLSRLMKMASNGQKYNDMIFQYKIYSLPLKFCYLDFLQMQNQFFPPKNEPEEVQPRKSMISEGQKKQFTQLTRHTFEISKVSLQIGVSDLPVPLLNLEVKNTKGSYDSIGSNSTVSTDPCIFVSYWNMLIGRWEPIVEQMIFTMNFKLGKQKYIIIDVLKPLLIDISLEAIKIFQLLLDDMKSKGLLEIVEKSEKKAKGVNISPYVLNNRTGMNLFIISGDEHQNVSSTKLRSNERIHLQMKSFDISKQSTKKVMFQIEGDPSEYQINLNEANASRIKIQFKDSRYWLIVKSISNSIVKELIITSPFIIENRTTFPFIFICGVEEIHVKPTEKIAINFMISLNKTMKIQFPALKNTSQNYDFLHQHLINGYEHYIKYNNYKTFNCVMTLKQSIETTILVQPSFYVKNLLPVDIIVQFAIINEEGEKDTFPQRLEVNQQKEIYDFGSKDDPEIRIKLRGFNISSFQKLAKEEDKSNYIQFVSLIDYRGHDGVINIKIVRQGKVRRVYIYSQFLLINETKFDFYAFNESLLIPGQKIKDVRESDTNYTFISNVKRINFGFTEENAFNSNQVSASEIGLQEVTMFKGNVLYEFIVKNTLHILDNISNIYSNVLKVHPKYVIVNRTSDVLEIAQVDMQSASVFVKQNERYNWSWPLKTEIKEIIVKVLDNQIQSRDDQWHFSVPFSLSKVEETTIVLRPKSNQPWKKILKITPIREHQSNFIVIEETIHEKDYLITIKNELRLCKLKLYQEYINTFNPIWAQNKYFDVGQNQIKPFGWDFPLQPHKIIAEVNFHGPLRGKYNTESIRVDLRSQNKAYHEITNEDNETYVIDVIVDVIGFKKVVTFKQRDFNEDYEDEEMQLHSLRQGLSIGEMGISIINGSHPRCELCFITVKKLEFILMEKKKSRTVQLKIKYINIDNNINHNTVYPILLTPLNYEKTMNKSRPFFVLLMEQTLGKKQIMDIKELRICLQPISVKIHDEVLIAGFEMFKAIRSINNHSMSDKIDLVSIYRSYFKETQWEDLELRQQTFSIFIQEFQIARLSLEISFSIRPRLNTENFIIMTIISSFGVAISNVSDAQLTMSRYLKRSTTLNELITSLNDYYKKEFFKGIYKVLGSINLLGNPYVFLKLVGEGTWEIVNQPTEGFIKGPIDGTIGIMKGGIYFTRNVVAGTFNSFEAISESLSRGISYVTMDEKFIERRQKIKQQKSTHLLTGFQYGMFSIYTGFEVAVTGLVRHPVQGYESSGIKGGLTGSLKGIAGLVTKPISGVFEGVSKISQGIKNTALLFQDGPNSKRARPPRVFITDLEYYEDYNFNKSEAIALLQVSSTKFLNNKIIFLEIINNRQQNILDALVLTNVYFCYVDLRNKKIMNEVHIGEIKEINFEESQLTIFGASDPIIVRDGNFKALYDEFKKILKNQEDT